MTEDVKELLSHFEKMNHCKHREKKEQSGIEYLFSLQELLIPKDTAGSSKAEWQF